jgi:hypothetical protein
MGMAILEDVVVPRGFARKDGEDVVIEYDPDYGPAWLAFAQCKALWLGEPSHRQEMTGSTEHRFSVIEETECLTSAAGVHAAQMEKGEEGPSDPFLLHVLAAIEDGFVTQLVLSELAARVDPQYTLTLDDDTRQKLRDYIIQRGLLFVHMR